MIICDVNLRQATTTVIEEQSIGITCVGYIARWTGKINYLRPTSGVGGTGELVDASLAVCSIELGKPAIAIVEEQGSVGVSRYENAGDDVRPPCGVGRTRNLIDASLAVGTIELCKSATTVIEEQIRGSFTWSAGRKNGVPARNDVCPAFGVGGTGELVDASLAIGRVKPCQATIGIVKKE